jgi:hypothetical protein
MEEGFAFAGSNAYMATEISYVSDVIKDLVTGYNHESLLRQLSAVRTIRHHSECSCGIAV